MKKLLKDALRLHEKRSQWDYDRWFYPHEVPNRGGGTFTVELYVSPIMWLTTNNTDERYLRAILPNFSDARLLHQWERSNVDYGPNNRPVVRGVIKCQLWDLRKALGVDIPLRELLGQDCEWLEAEGVELD